MTAPRFGRPKRGVARAGQDAAEIGPVLRRFAAESGSATIVANCPDFLNYPGFDESGFSKSSEKSGRSTRRLRRQFTGIIPVTAPRFGRPKRGVVRAAKMPRELGPLLRRFAPESVSAEIVANCPDFFKNPGFDESGFSKSSEKSGRSTRRLRRQFLGLITVMAPRFGRPKSGVVRAGEDAAEIGPLLRRLAPGSGSAKIAASRPDFLKNPGFDESGFSKFPENRADQHVGRDGRFRS